MKFSIAMAFIAAAFLVTFLTMTMGWGLEVASWPWIIGGWFLSAILFGIGKALTGEGK